MSEKRRVLQSRTDTATPSRASPVLGRAKAVQQSTTPTTSTKASNSTSTGAAAALTTSSLCRSVAVTSLAKGRASPALSGSSVITPVQAGSIKARVLGYSSNVESPLSTKNTFSSSSSSHHTPSTSSANIANPPPTSVSTKSFDRRVRAASTEPPCLTPPANESPISYLVPRQPASPCKEAFPILASARTTHETTAPYRALKRNNSQLSDPLKPSNTSRAISHLLPSAHIAPPASTVFARFSGASPSPAGFCTSASTSQRPISPHRRPHSPLRAQTSPVRSASFFPPSVPSSPLRASSTVRRPTSPVHPSTPSTKRTFNPSDSSSSTSTCSSLSASIFSDSAQTLTPTAVSHHRTRRRSRSLGSSISSISNLSTHSLKCEKDFISSEKKDDQRYTSGTSLPLPPLSQATLFPPSLQRVNLLPTQVQHDAKVNRKVGQIVCMSPFAFVNPLYASNRFSTWKSPTPPFCRLTHLSSEPR